MYPMGFLSGIYEVWCNDMDWSDVEYFIYDFEELSDYLDTNK